jgi:N-acetylglucosaminyldiphosphoundecaprenol N-acetyl-beta-D-mannosaminyltransferase
MTGGPETPGDAGGAGRQRFTVLGVGVDAIEMRSAVELIKRWTARRERAYAVFCTVSSVLSARSQPEVRSAFEQADLVAPDGMPLVWIGRRSGHRVDRVYGPI